jgi:hypothetical protein
MKYFMTDIESMGTNFDEDDIIQIAFLELNRAADGTYIPGDSLSKTLYTSQKPKNDWIANTHRDLLEVCRRTPRSTPEKVRNEIVSFFRWCGVNEPALLMGLQATTFDVPYLVHKGYLKKPTQDANNALVGDYHYRIYELKGAFNLAQDVLGVDSKTLYQLAERAAPEMELPQGKAHEALYDCYRQAKVLNGVIRLLKQAKAG